MAEPAGANESQSSILTRLGLNRSTAALLAGILLIGMGQELWSPFMPKFIEQTIEDRMHDRLSLWGLPAWAVIVLAVGLFGTWRDFQEGLYYYLGGRLGGALGTRTAAEVLRLPVGQISPGYRCDLVALDLDDPSLWPSQALEKNVVYALSPRAITDVVVDGQEVVSAQRLCHVSLDEIQARVAELTRGWSRD